MKTAKFNTEKIATFALNNKALILLLVISIILSHRLLVNYANRKQA